MMSVLQLKAASVLSTAGSSQLPRLGSVRRTSAARRTAVLTRAVASPERVAGAEHKLVTGSGELMLCR